MAIPLGYLSADPARGIKPGGATEVAVHAAPCGRITGVTVDKEHDRHAGKKVWIELCVEVPVELCDVVSEFLVSTLGRGVLIEDVPEGGSGSGDRERIRAYLGKEDLDAGLLPEIEAYVMDLSEVHSRGTDLRISTRPVIEEDWHEGWKAFFKPARVGKLVVVKPSWENYVPRPRDIVIEIDPGRVFGTGTHPSTSLVIKAMEELWTARGWLGKDAGGRMPSVLDVGTGTGILGITAARLGASWVLCLDVDPDAVETTRQNAFRNHVHHLVSATVTPIWQIEEEFDVVLANIDEATLLLLAEDIVKRVACRGWVILSGILLEQGDSVKDAFTGLGLELEKGLEEGEWMALVFNRPH